MISQNNLKKFVTYDKQNGLFRWKERIISDFCHCQKPNQQLARWNTMYSYKVAGGRTLNKKSKTEYIQICIKTAHVISRNKAHILAWLYMTGEFPNHDIDHIDHNGLNNSWNNLRLATHKENHKNVRIQSNNTSGFTGVSWSVTKQKWRVYLTVDGVQKYGGHFNDIIDAVKKRMSMNIQYGFHKNHGMK